MPYIGQEPVAGNFVLLDAITTSATATYALTKNSVAYSPESSRNMIVSLNGVTQAPEAAYTVSGSNITFSSALTASDVIDYILILGDVLDIGRPSDGVVGTDQMNYPLGNFSSTGIDDNATSTAITIDSSENVGIGTASPTSTASAGPTLEISGTAGGNLVLSDSNATSGQRAKYLLSQGGALYVGHSADNGTSPVNDLVINASGNVGIGTTSPTGFTGYTSLDINNATSGALIDLSQGDAMKGRLIATASTMAIETASSVPIIFQPAGTEAMRIDSSGQVGIGIAPYATRKLTVFGTGAGEATVMIEGEGGADPCINFLANNTQHWTLGIDDSDADKFKLSEHSALGTNDYLVVDVSGNVGIGTTSPSNTLTVNKDTGSTPTVYINNSGADPTDGPALKVQASGRGSGIADVSVFSVHNISDEIFTVRNDGNVGIGTASPARELEIRLADDTTTTLGQKGGISLYAPSNTGGNGGEITWASAVNGEVWAAISGHITANGSGVASGALVFGTGNNSALPTERMRIDSSGTINIGTTAAGGGSGNVGVGFTQIGRTISNCDGDWNYEIFGAQGNRIRFFTSAGGGTQVGSITVTTSTTAYNTSSDERLKENIVDAPAGNIDDIRVRSFDWKADRSHQTYGMVAQELVDVAPEAVTQGNTEDDLWSVDYSKLVPMMIKEIQDLKAEVAALKGE
jgi:hypothetical protein